LFLICSELLLILKLLFLIWTCLTMSSSRTQTFYLLLTANNNKKYSQLDYKNSSSLDFALLYIWIFYIFTSIINKNFYFIIIQNKIFEINKIIQNY
jgi:hypothetical protein